MTGSILYNAKHCFLFHAHIFSTVKYILRQWVRISFLPRFPDPFLSSLNPTPSGTSAHCSGGSCSAVTLPPRCHTGHVMGEGWEWERKRVWEWEKVRERTCWVADWQERAYSTNRVGDGGGGSVAVRKTILVSFCALFSAQLVKSIFHLLNSEFYDVELVLLSIMYWSSSHILYA